MWLWAPGAHIKNPRNDFLTSMILRLHNWISKLCAYLASHQIPKQYQQPCRSWKTRLQFQEGIKSSCNFLDVRACLRARARARACVCVCVCACHFHVLSRFVFCVDKFQSMCQVSTSIIARRFWSRKVCMLHSWWSLPDNQWVTVDEYLAS